MVSPLRLVGNNDNYKTTGMNTNDNFTIMTNAAKQLKDIIQGRLNSRLDAVNTLQGSSLDNVPDEVKKMREIEAGKTRAVMQEQKDLIELIKTLYPDA
jgi:hypothetical protein